MICTLVVQGLHSASVPGILALDLSGDSSRALTGEKVFLLYMYFQLTVASLLSLSLSFPPSLTIGGADKNAIVFDKDSGKIVATLKGHSKKVTSAVYHPREVGTLPCTQSTYMYLYMYEMGVDTSC